MKYEISIINQDSRNTRDAVTHTIIEQERETGMDRRLFHDVIWPAMCEAHADSSCDRTYAAMWIDGHYTRVWRLTTGGSFYDASGIRYTLETMDVRIYADGGWKEIRSGIWAD